MTRRLYFEEILPPPVNVNRWGGWPKVAWDKDSEALLVSVGETGMVLEHEGAHIDYEVSEVSHCIEDLGLVPPDDGVWIWKGKYKVYECGYETREYESEPVGEFRRCTAEELEKLSKGEDVLMKQPLNPDYCEKLRKAIDADDIRQVSSMIDELRFAHDLNYEDTRIFVSEVMGWKASSTSCEKFEELMQRCDAEDTKR